MTDRPGRDEPTLERRNQTASSAPSDQEMRVPASILERVAKEKFPGMTVSQMLSTVRRDDIEQAIQTLDTPGRSPGWSFAVKRTAERTSARLAQETGREKLMEAIKRSSATPTPPAEQPAELFAKERARQQSLEELAKNAHRKADFKTWVRDTRSGALPSTATGPTPTEVTPQAQNSAGAAEQSEVERAVEKLRRIATGQLKPIETGKSAEEKQGWPHMYVVTDPQTRIFSSAKIYETVGKDTHNDPISVEARIPGSVPEHWIIEVPQPHTPAYFQRAPIEIAQEAQKTFDAGEKERSITTNEVPIFFLLVPPTVKDDLVTAGTARVVKLNDIATKK